MLGLQLGKLTYLTTPVLLENDVGFLWQILTRSVLRKYHETFIWDILALWKCKQWQHDNFIQHLKYSIDSYTLNSSCCISKPEETEQ